jgi:hypothetical protein
MPSYVRERVAAGIIADAFGLYFRNFWLFLMLYLVPDITAVVLTGLVSLVEKQQELLFDGLSALLGLVGQMVALAMLTVAISDVCLGNPPRLGRCLRIVWQRIGPVAGSSLLVGVVVVGITFMTAGVFLPFNVPFAVLWVMLAIALVVTMLLFTSTIVIVERRGPVEAMRRSVQLGRGFYWRNFGIVLLTIITVTVPAFLLHPPPAPHNPLEVFKLEISDIVGSVPRSCNASSIRASLF